MARAWMAALAVGALLAAGGRVQAQSGTSSALVGTVRDKTGALVAGAIVVAMNVDTKAARTGTTDDQGMFRFAQINPGTYRVTVEREGFARAESRETAVNVAQTVALEFVLDVAAAGQTVEVTAEQGLASLENANTTTTIQAEAIKNMPNAGQDLTFLAQFAEGALMNTAGSSNDAKAAGGYGNVEFNGLPATSNGYILDGYDTNDPWLGLNIGLSTNLVIGLDAVQEVTVNTNSFSVDQGRYAVAQVDYFTKSGTNAFHGDAYEIWNGSRLNAEDYFLHANDTPGNAARKPRSVVNEFGISAGGPLRRNKLFFFAHYEGIRIALPLVDQVTLPSPAYQQYVLQQLPVGGVDPVTGTSLPPEPAELPFYQQMFALLPNAAGTPVQVQGCPLGTNGDGCASQHQASLNNSDSENLLVVKIDQTLGRKDSLWWRFQQDTGLQAAYTDPVNAIFNSYSPQPQRTLVAGYTHVFSEKLVNQFNPGASWYASIFEPNQFAQVQQTFPIVLMAGSGSVPFSTIGGNDQTYPQGRKVTQWQVNDNLTWIAGRHTVKLGINTRRVDVSDYDLGEGTVPTVTYNDLAEFTYGAAYSASQTFPAAMKERVAVGNLEWYAMDTYAPNSRTTLTCGMRVTWNKDETSQQGLFARPPGSFLDMTHNSAQPLADAIQTHLHNLFPETPLFVYQPRVSVARQLPWHMAVHAGVGGFNDIIPAQIADLASGNAPYAPTFVAGLAGQLGSAAANGAGIVPGVPGSAVDATVRANTAFQSAFAQGLPTPFPVGLNTFPSGTLKPPFYWQYNLGVEKQVGARGSLRVDFVGTHGLHEPYQVELNGYESIQLQQNGKSVACTGCFAPYPSTPADARFGSVDEFQTGAGSSYAGLQMAYAQQFHGLTLRGNYTLSHCLDEVSNGGLLAFSTQGILSPLPGELGRSYGDCDYDVRHNVSGFGMYQVPFKTGHKALQAIAGGWSVSATLFHHTGLPFTVLSQPYTYNNGGVLQASGPQYARRAPGVPVYRKTPYPGVTVAGTLPWLNPDAFVSVVDPATGQCSGGDSVANCQFGDSGRNTVRGPNFTDSDVYVTKIFALRDEVKLRLDLQMFNAFNHPNFALPSEVEAGVPGMTQLDIPARFGTLQSTISPPTGLLGVGLGGDSAPRMIAFQGRIEF